MATIFQRIALEGGGEILSQLRELGKSGEEAFQAISRASQTNSFKAFAEGIAGIAAAVVGTGTALAAWAEKSAEAVKSLGDLAAQAGASIENMTALRATLATLGVDTSTLETSFKRLAVRIATDWPAIQKEISDSANKAKKDLLDLADATAAVEKAEFELANIERNQTAQRLKDINSVSSATIALEEAQLNLRKQQGFGADPTIEKDLANRKALLAVEQAEQSLADARAAQADNIAQAELKRVQAENAVAEAILKQEEVRKKAVENQRNDINTLIKAVDDMAKGIKVSSETANLSAENILKGVIGSVGKSLEGLKDVKGGLVDLASANPKVIDGLFKLSDVMKNTSDQTTKMGIAFKAFGRGVTQDFIEALSQGSGELQKMMNRLKEAGLIFTEQDRLISETMHHAWVGFKTDIEIITTQLGLLFAPVFTRGFQDLARYIEENRDAMVTWASSVRDVVAPIIYDFFNLVTGKHDFSSSWAPLFEVLKKVKEAFAALAPFFLQAGADLIRDVGNIVREISIFFTDLDKVMKNTFGLDFSSAALLISLGLLRTALVTIRPELLLLVAAIKILGNALDEDAVKRRIAHAKESSLYDYLIGDALKFLGLDNEANKQLGDKKDLLDQLGSASADYAGLEKGERAYTTALNDGTKATEARTKATEGLIDKLKTVQNLVDETAVPPEFQSAAWKAAHPAIDLFGVDKGATGVTDQAALQTQAQQIVDPFRKAADEITALWNTLKDVINKTISEIVTAFNSAALEATDTWGGVPGLMDAIFQQIVTSANGMADQIVTAMQRALQAIQNVQQAASNANVPSGGGGFAGGGRIYGPGTPTSDSVPIWTSVGEFVHRARAAMYYGYDVMNALNNMTIPRELFRGFNLGGLVEAIGPRTNRFAEGGRVSSDMRPFVLDLGTMGRFKGSIAAPDSVLETLSREAAFDLMSSGGKPPIWRTRR